MNRGLVVAGVLALAAAPAVPAAAAGVAMVLERVEDPANLLRWIRTGDVLRYEVRLSGMARDARLAVAATPVHSLTKLSCATDAPAGAAGSGGTAVVLARRALDGDAVAGARACRLGKITSSRAVQVELSVPAGAEEVEVAAVARVREENGRLTTITRTATTQVDTTPGEPSGGQRVKGERGVAPEASGARREVDPAGVREPSRARRAESSGRNTPEPPPEGWRVRGERWDGPEASSARREGGPEASEGRQAAREREEVPQEGDRVNAAETGREVITWPSETRRPGAETRAEQRHGDRRWRADGWRGDGQRGRAQGVRARDRWTGTRDRWGEGRDRGAGTRGRWGEGRGRWAGTRNHWGGARDRWGGTRNRWDDGRGRWGHVRDESFSRAGREPGGKRAWDVEPPRTWPGERDVRMPEVAPPQVAPEPVSGAPLPRVVEGAQMRVRAEEPMNPLAGPQGLPYAAGGIAVLCAGLWAVARRQSRRMREKVF